MIHQIPPLPGIYPGHDRLPGEVPVGDLIQHQGCVYTAIRHEDSHIVLDRPLAMAQAGMEVL